jgi:hypothetical protein
MVLVGHSQRVAEPLTRRQRRAMAGVAAGFAAATIVAIVLIVTLPSGIPASRDGCVSVAVASSTGGDLIRRCGAGARSLCADAYSGADGAGTAVAEAVIAQCRKAGIGPPRRRG